MDKQMSISLLNDKERVATIVELIYFDVNKVIRIVYDAGIIASGPSWSNSDPKDSGRSLLRLHFQMRRRKTILLINWKCKQLSGGIFLEIMFSRLTRWIERIIFFDYKFEQMPGAEIGLSDYLSRHPVGEALRGNAYDNK